MEEILEKTRELVTVVDIQFRQGQKVYFFDPNGLTLAVGDHVIMDTARGPEYGICTGGNHEIPASAVVAPLRCILRKATKADEDTVAENRKKEKRAYDICLQRIADHGLDMQLVSAEYAFDGSKLLFFFTADDRVDFRELVKNLAAIFHTRIELRQIGVRDKAKMVGGLGICGRPFCCASFLEDFQPVSIKMAKTQSLSLNPAKISGTCGRLLCCLKYEQETYEVLIRMSPKAESLVDTPDGRGTVTETLLLQESVKVALDSDPENPRIYKIADIAVLRNGKGKKNDAPIPSDYAPVSGNAEAAEKKEEAPILEEIRFRYSTEKIVEEKTTEDTEKAEAAPETPKKPRPDRRRKRSSGLREGEKPEKKEKPDHKEAPEKKERPNKKPFPPKEKSEKPGKAPKSGEKPARNSEAGEKPARISEAGEKPERKNRPYRRHYRKPKPKAE